MTPEEFACDQTGERVPAAGLLAAWVCFFVHLFIRSVFKIRAVLQGLVLSVNSQHRAALASVHCGKDERVVLTWALNHVSKVGHSFGYGLSSATQQASLWQGRASDRDFMLAVVQCNGEVKLGGDWLHDVPCGSSIYLLFVVIASAPRLEAIASRLEAIAIRFLLSSRRWKRHHQSFSKIARPKLERFWQPTGEVKPNRHSLVLISAWEDRSSDCRQVVLEALRSSKGWALQRLGQTQTSSNLEAMTLVAMASNLIAIGLQPNRSGLQSTVMRK